jgi:alpha-glucosidase
MKFSCEKTAEGMHLKIGPHEGTYPAWWKEIRAEIFGWTPKQGKVFVNAKLISSPINQQVQSISFLIRDEGMGAEVEVK